MDNTFLKELALKTIADCTFPKSVNYFGKKSRMQLLLPSGDEKYPSFWVRDCAMMAESGLVDDELLKNCIEIIALHGVNTGDTIHLENGLTVPPYAVADHINYDAKPVYFPGTYDSGANQGNGNFGFFPPFCDNYYYVMMVCQYIKQSHNTDILKKEYHNKTLEYIINEILKGYNIDKETELCFSDEKKYTVDWGFVDTVKKSGKLLMASLLRYNAATSLQEIFPENSAYKTLAQKIKAGILKCFFDQNSGWFYSATGTGKQHDVWATAYAVYLGITANEKTLNALKQAYKNKTAVADGYVRHILTNADFSPTSAWQETNTPYNTYQNGAYWATPTGWYAYAISITDRNLAFKLLEDFKKHTLKHQNSGAPFEWINKDTSDKSGLLYGTSGVLPYIGFKKILNNSGM